MISSNKEKNSAFVEESNYYHSKKIMQSLGYNTIQEGFADLIIEGYYNKEENTWTEITDPSDIKTTRAHMNLAQAKYYGLEIIRAEPE